ncbi:hypothetical protein M758_10G122800 [Ceratodon purpureus]|uniref:Uncharacterized protein n=1 Tax=Ceratodon purpureus TaxID=3225 RepID=A0A8T0GMK9_CERPU|nr:hypothetical protein KC19_10G127700 [Ceratodon purpureus]KAG0603819.1 hypothetical protein M758_10G122800 [Ceratodon purpureus]
MLLFILHVPIVHISFNYVSYIPASGCQAQVVRFIWSYSCWLAGRSINLPMWWTVDIASPILVLILVFLAEVLFGHRSIFGYDTRNLKKRKLASAMKMRIMVMG